MSQETITKHEFIRAERDAVAICKHCNVLIVGKGSCSVKRLADMYDRCGKLKGACISRPKSTTDAVREAERFTATCYQTASYCGSMLVYIHSDTKKHITALIARVKELESENNQLKSNIEERVAVNIELLKENKQLRQEREILAKLASDKPEFFNPVIAMKAKALRDEILRKD